MKIKKFTFNPFLENTYLLWDELTYSAAIIDPGMYSSEEELEIKSFIKENSLEIIFMINTHCHLDHLLGSKFIKEVYDPVYYVPENDLPLFNHAQKQAEMFGISINELPPVDKFLSENEKLPLGKEPIQNIFTPGHSPGEFCLYVKEAKFCLTGDVLFKESIGRTDLYGGNYNVLLSSIKDKLFNLDDDVVIYPGHGEESTIGYEKKNNPFLI